MRFPIRAQKAHTNVIPFWLNWIKAVFINRRTVTVKGEGEINYYLIKDRDEVNTKCCEIESLHY